MRVNIKLPPRLRRVFDQTFAKLPAFTRRALLAILNAEEWTIKVDRSADERGALASVFSEKRRIVFSTNWADLPDSELARVCAHELAHVYVGAQMPELHADEVLMDCITHTWGFGPNRKEQLKRFARLNGIKVAID